MTREQRVRESIDKAVAQGFTFYKTGTGNYEDLFNQMRAEGYVVAAWYLTYTKSEQLWEMYLKEKTTSKKKAQPVQINYGELNVKELKKICSEKKIAGYSKMNKVQMIESLQQAC